jgi:hypothetical protein
VGMHIPKTSSSISCTQFSCRFWFSSRGHSSHWWSIYSTPPQWYLASIHVLFKLTHKHHRSKVWRKY